MTNNYRGCIASLYNSLRITTMTRAEMQADRNCRAKGLEAGTSALAVCVLHESTSNSGAIESVGLMVTPYRATAVSDASIPEILRREQLACAEIGLEPAQRGFANCVQGLRDVLSASLMDTDYQD